MVHFIPCYHRIGELPCQACDPEDLNFTSCSNHEGCEARRRQPKGSWQKSLPKGICLFSRQEMEPSLIGLQNAGKTSLVNVIATGGFGEDMIPTVGFNMKKVVKGSVTIQLWDLGGQRRFRSMWERYCRGVSAIVSRQLTHFKMASFTIISSLNGIPLLVLGNKVNIPGALRKEDLMDQMDLKALTGREVGCFMISCKNSTNIDTAIEWFIKH